MDKIIRFRNLSVPLKVVISLAWFWGIAQTLVAMFYFFVYLLYV